MGSIEDGRLVVFALRPEDGAEIFPEFRCVHLRWAAAACTCFVKRFDLKKSPALIIRLQLE